MVDTRAVQKANEVIDRVNHTMALEAQNVTSDELREDRVLNWPPELIRTQLRSLWDDKRLGMTNEREKCSKISPSPMITTPRPWRRTKNRGYRRRFL